MSSLTVRLQRPAPHPPGNGRAYFCGNIANRAEIPSTWLSLIDIVHTWYRHLVILLSWQYHEGCVLLTHESFFCLWVAAWLACRNVELWTGMKSRASIPTFGPGIWRGSGAEWVSCPNCCLRHAYCISVGGSDISEQRGLCWLQQRLVDTNSLFLTIMPYTSAHKHVLSSWVHHAKGLPYRSWTQ